MTAVNWGTPTPATTRVVQMEPGPTPTFTAVHTGFDKVLRGTLLGYHVPGNHSLYPGWLP